MYATPADVPLTHTFNAAQKYSAKLDVHGRQDWRVPTFFKISLVAACAAPIASWDELNVLFQNRAAIGGFDISGSHPAGWYWSSSQILNLLAWAQRFSDGYQNHGSKNDDSSLRCVR